MARPCFLHHGLGFEQSCARDNPDRQRPARRLLRLVPSAGDPACVTSRRNARHYALHLNPLHLQLQRRRRSAPGQLLGPQHPSVDVHPRPNDLVLRPALRPPVQPVLPHRRPTSRHRVPHAAPEHLCRPARRAATRSGPESPSSGQQRRRRRRSHGRGGSDRHPLGDGGAALLFSRPAPVSGRRLVLGAPDPVAVVGLFSAQSAAVDWPGGHK